MQQNLARHGESNVYLVSFSRFPAQRDIKYWMILL